jgi:hypothetical protein
MKKPKALAKFKRKPTAEEVQPAPARVTNDSVSHHRDEILSKGRRFKYPFHRSKHRVAIISIIVVVAAVALLSGFTGLQLYKLQSTSDFTHSVTSVLPFPIAKVNGSYVSYESYLFELNSSVHWQEKYGTTDLKSPDGKRQIEFLKRSALDKALTNNVAHTLAKKNNISVTDEEVDQVVARIKSSGGDLSQILGESFNFTESDLRRYIKDNILGQKVARDLDKEAPQRAQAVLSQLKAGKAFADAAKESSEDLETKQIAGDIGVVEKDRANLPPEVSNAIFKLQAGQVSDVITTASDYFIVTVNERVDETRAKVSIIRIKVKDMAQYLSEYRDQKKVSEYIKLNKTDSDSE